MKKNPLVILLAALFFGNTPMTTAQTVDVDRTK